MEYIRWGFASYDRETKKRRVLKGDVGGDHCCSNDPILFKTREEARKMLKVIKLNPKLFTAPFNVNLPKAFVCKVKLVVE